MTVIQQPVGPFFNLIHQNHLCFILCFKLLHNLIYVSSVNLIYNKYWYNYTAQREMHLWLLLVWSKGLCSKRDIAFEFKPSLKWSNCRNLFSERSGITKAVHENKNEQFSTVCWAHLNESNDASDSFSHFTGKIILSTFWYWGYTLYTLIKIWL